MFIIMFTFVVFSHQLTLPFPSSWNIDVNLDNSLSVLFFSLVQPNQSTIQYVYYTTLLHGSIQRSYLQKSIKNQIGTPIKYIGIRYMRYCNCYAAAFYEHIPTSQSCYMTVHGYMHIQKHISIL